MRSTVNNLNVKLEQDGSPYRWEHKDLGGGTESIQRYLIGSAIPTVADAKLKQDIMALINQSESNDSMKDGKLIETRLLKQDETSVTETWVIHRTDGKDVAYTIEMKLTSSGETDISLRGPWK